MIFLIVLGHAVRTGLRFPLEQVACSAEQVFSGDGRRKLVKHLRNPRPLGMFARSLWGNGDCDRGVFARAERGSSETTKLRHNTPVSSRFGCSTTATSGGITSGGRNHCVRRNDPLGPLPGPLPSPTASTSLMTACPRSRVFWLCLRFGAFSARGCLSAPKQRIPSLFPIQKQKQVENKKKQKK